MRDVRRRHRVVGRRRPLARPAGRPAARPGARRGRRLRQRRLHHAHRRRTGRAARPLGAAAAHPAREDQDRRGGGHPRGPRPGPGGRDAGQGRDDVDVFVDANGAYSPGQARRVAERLLEWGVTWFEEPVSSDDLPGLAATRFPGGPDIAAGEYGYDLPYFARMLPSVDCLQVDVTRCGGYTEWQRAAALAAAVNRDVSAHCAPNLSAHAAAATQNFRHIEWFADHDRIERRFFDGCLDPAGGTVAPDLTAPGHGLVFRAEAAAEYAA
ncbi:enolase C-terminal domain-like protein [Amycolatopsis sp. NPDC098790]|uniref:enolase C-terminal domain-like protein n=1 Tax=Amycolatopsis sp. NPDC098790 TaxID=3363939 RepID=UPI00381B6ADA